MQDLLFQSVLQIFNRILLFVKKLFSSSWIVYSAATFDNIVKTLHMQLVETPSDQRNHQMLDSALSGFNAFARALTETLSTNAYLCGHRYVSSQRIGMFTRLSEEQTIMDVHSLLQMFVLTSENLLLFLLQFHH